jgi:PhnB protein
MQTITPSLTVIHADAAIAFYQKLFGATLRMRMPSADGRSVMHAELVIGESTIFINDEFPNMCQSPARLGGSPVHLHIVVADVDAIYQQALEAGVEPVMPPADMFWGDRYAQFIDPFGHIWGIATRKEHLTDEQKKQRAEEFVKNQAVAK